MKVFKNPKAVHLLIAISLVCSAVAVLVGAYSSYQALKLREAVHIHDQLLIKLAQGQLPVFEQPDGKQESVTLFFLQEIQKINEELKQLKGGMVAGAEPTPTP